MKVSITNNHMKMKNIWIIIFLGSLLFGSCKKESKDAYEVEKVFPDTEEVFKEFKRL
jgi:ribosomal silencing factor RsfS